MYTFLTRQLEGEHGYPDRGEAQWDRSDQEGLRTGQSSQQRAQAKHIERWTIAAFHQVVE